MRAELNRGLLNNTLGDAKSSRWVTLRARWVTFRDRDTAAARTADAARPSQRAVPTSRKSAQQLAGEQEELERANPALLAAAATTASLVRGTSGAKKRREILAAVARTSRDPHTAAAAVHSALGQLLRTLLRCCLSSPPETLPAHEVLCFGFVERLRARLHPCPRPALERSLRCPQTILQCRCCPNNGGLSAKLPDTPLCYVLMDRQGEFIEVQEWFAAFAAIHPPPKQATITAFFAAEHGGEPFEPAPPPPASQRKTRGRGDAAGDDDAAHSEALQARFTRATAELQFLGLLRPTKRRRGDYVQRLAFENPLTTEELEAAANTSD